ncbi:galactose-1-phosphate uridylyltransferase [Thermopirellula anaerolimosa]
MPELRKDPIVDRWVIIADNRGKRPQDFEIAPRRSTGRLCPFCEGNESETPAEVLCVRDPGTLPNGPGWKIRVVPNKFPAVLDGEFNLPSSPDHALYQARPGHGIHEVIIESPRHVSSLTQLTTDEIVLALATYRRRFEALETHPGLSSVMLFKNMGAEAGASLEHIHSQLIALPTIPSLPDAELHGAKAQFDASGRCVYCRMLRAETDSPRGVYLSPRFTAFCPFASRFGYETWILPNRHASHFQTITDDEIRDLAGVLRRVLTAVETVVRPPAYNLVFHTAPLGGLPLEHYHWHIEVLPAFAKAAGFEWGSGFYINPVYPEQAAQELRQSLEKCPESEDETIRQTEADRERLPMP